MSTSNTPQGNIDVQHIAVDLRFDWAARQAIASARITLVPLKPSATVALDAARLKIESVQDEAGRALPFEDSAAALKPDAWPENGNLRIRLAEAAPAGKPLTVTIHYRTGWVNDSDPNNLWGSNGRGLRFHQPSGLEPLRRPHIWSSGAAGAVRWWLPGHDHPADVRTSELRITVQAPMQALAGGELQSVQHHADGSRTFHWRSHGPEPHHRSNFVVGEFTPIPQHHPKVALMNWGYADEAAAVAASVVMQPDALNFFTKLLGQPFPHPGHRQVFVQELPWNLSASGMSVLTENFVDDLGTHHDFQYLWDGLQSESLVQQWLGGHWPLCDWRHAWLERGLAHHLAALYTEHRHGRDEYLLWYVAANQATALGDVAQGLREPVLPTESLGLQELNAFVNGNTPFFRGATVMHGLRELLGAPAWQRTLRRFADRPRGEPLCTEQLQAAAEAEYGKPLGWYFEQWLRYSSYPVLEVSTAWKPSRKSTSGASQEGQLLLTVKQVQAAAAGESAPMYVQGPIDVLIDDQVRRVHMQPQASNEFRFNLKLQPQLVHLDPASAWLKELRHAKSEAALLHQLRHAKSSPARQWAAAELLRIVQAGGATAPALRPELFKALLETAASTQHYWRVRFLALGQAASLVGPAQKSLLDEAVQKTLLRIIETEESWVRTAAVRLLGLAREPRHAALFQRLLQDDSDRVVNGAAIALGRTGSPSAFDALKALPAKPSWKNQSLISALNGLAELRDPRGAAIALAAFNDLRAPHWTLATPVWDHRFAAVDTLVALNSTEAATQAALQRFDQALAENVLNDIFINVQMLVGLGDAATARVFPVLKDRFKDDGEALKATQAFEQRYAATRKQRESR